MDLTQAGLEPSPAAMRELIQRAADYVIAYYESLGTQRASDTDECAEVARLVVEPMPEQGQPYEGLLELIFLRLISKGFNTNAPGSFSYINGGSLLHCAIADFITAVTNPYVGYWGAAPGMAQVEETVIRWFSDMIGLPAGAGGVLLSGGSIANLSALIAARKALLGDDFKLGTLYASDQVHHSVNKAAMLAGFPEDALRLIPSDDAFRLRIDALAERVAEDRQAGRRPFFVIGTAGTTNSGAVDDLRSLAQFASANALWFHVDAAYGGFFALTERGKAVLRGIELADTVVLDPHKSLFTPFGTGCLLARDVRKLQSAHELHSDYIDAAVDLGIEAGAVSFADLSPELSRGMRGLRIWLPMKLLGAEAFRRALDEKLDLAALAAAKIAVMPGFELVAGPELSTLAFRAHEAGLSGAERDQLNMEVLDRVNRRGRVHLSATLLDGRYTLRICVLSLRSHEAALASCLKDLRECREP